MCLDSCNNQYLYMQSDCQKLYVQHLHTLIENILWALQAYSCSAKNNREHVITAFHQPPSSRCHTLDLSLPIFHPPGKPFKLFHDICQLYVSQPSEAHPIATTTIHDATLSNIHRDPPISTDGFSST